jgi:hypothetical protein
MPPLLRYADVENQPALQIVFPLAADHYLITLVQYNVIRALLFNGFLLSILHLVPGAVNCRGALGIPPSSSEPDQVPMDLRPTRAQASFPAHAAWIDGLPFPQLRDNLVLTQEAYDGDDLCYDLFKGLYEGFDDPERRGCLV